MNEYQLMDKLLQGRALDLFIHNKHLDSSSAGCELPSGATSADVAVATPAKLLSTSILRKTAASSNSKFSLVSAKPHMKDLTILSKCQWHTTLLASNFLNLRFSESSSSLACSRFLNSLNRKNIVLLEIANQHLFVVRVARWSPMSPSILPEPQPTAPQLPTVDIAICCNRHPTPFHAPSPKIWQPRNQLMNSSNELIEQPQTALVPPNAMLAPPRVEILSKRCPRCFQSVPKINFCSVQSSSRRPLHSSYFCVRKLLLGTNSRQSSSHSKPFARSCSSCSCNVIVMVAHSKVKLVTRSVTSVVVVTFAFVRMRTNSTQQPPKVVGTEYFTIFLSKYFTNRSILSLKRYDKLNSTNLASWPKVLLHGQTKLYSKTPNTKAASVAP